MRAGLHRRAATALTVLGLLLATAAVTGPSARALVATDVPVCGGASAYPSPIDPGWSCTWGASGQGLPASPAPVGTPVHLLGLDYMRYCPGYTTGNALTRVEWDLDGNGVTDLVQTGPWQLRSTYFDGLACYYADNDVSADVTFAAAGNHPVSVTTFYADGTSQTETGVIPVVADADTAGIATPAYNPSTGWLTGAPLVLSAAPSTSLSGAFSAYAWDLDGDGTYETPGGATQPVSWDTPGNKTVGLQVTSRGGVVADTTATFDVRTAPASWETGFSVNDGSSYTDSAAVTLNVRWPAGASAMRVSNDGGFSSVTTLPLSAAVPWTLDDSVSGLYTKVVYMRFSGSGLDTTKTYTDDIVLDTTAPVLHWASQGVTSAGVVIRTSATDALSGVALLQSDVGGTVTTSPYAPSVTVGHAAGAGVATSATAPRAASVKVRVRDKAGNWTAWRSVAPAGLSLTTVHYDAPGPDRKTAKSLNGEWFSVTNHASTPVALVGVSVSNSHGAIYRFPAKRLAPGASLTVYTGPGKATRSTLYWGSRTAVWPNAAGTATLHARGGATLSRCTWTKPGAGSTTCG